MKRWRAKLSGTDIEWLLELERRERERLYQQSAIWAAHRDRLLCICLGQGGARHLIDGRSGIKDFDLWTFFARRDDLPRRSVDSAFRKSRQRDFGRSRFGVRTDAYFRDKLRRAQRPSAAISSSSRSWNGGQLSAGVRLTPFAFACWP